MIPRRQLPVHSPINASALLPASRAALLGSGSDPERLVGELSTAFRARHVMLTDSGTSALVLALRMLVGEGRTVALPGYSCVDLVAAAVRARVKVRLYDIDPATLSPDLGSVDQVLEQGVDAVVVAHLYGFAADVPAVAALAAERGVPVIEDAAQGAGGSLHGARLGSFGALTVLSFGRGKGLTGGGGGALLILAPELAADSSRVPGIGRTRAGWHELASAAVQWVFGRPALYALPCAIPGLRLGEMVYRDANEPAAMSAASATLVHAMMPIVDREVAIRRRNAASMMDSLRFLEGLAPILDIEGARSGYLRLPVRVLDGRTVSPYLGAVAAYPSTLIEEEKLQPLLHASQPELTGAVELSRSLLTLPVHRFVTARDIARIGAWLRSQSAGRSRPGLLARA